MQVSYDGKPLDSLSRQDERELSSGRPRERAEGVVMTASEAITAKTRGLRFLYAFLGGLIALIMIPLLIGTALYEPRDLIVLAPLSLVLTAALALFMRLMYRRNTTKFALRAAEQAPRMAAAGVAVLVEASGLSIGADHYPWSALTVTALDIVTSGGESSVTLVNRIELDAAGRSIVLDSPLIRNGQLVVRDVWLRCRLEGRGSSA
jgi:hypothetical protein